MSKQMSEAERNRLRQIGAAQAKVAKAEAARVAAAKKAQFEEDLKRKFSWLEREEWKRPMQEAETAIEPLAARVDAECARLGIPKAFRPALSISWNYGGLQLAGKEAAEMRRLTHAAIDAELKVDLAGIELRQNEYTVAVLADGLSDHARTLLDRLPTVEALLAPMSMPKARSLFIDEMKRQAALPSYERSDAYRLLSDAEISHLVRDHQDDEQQEDDPS